MTPSEEPVRASARTRLGVGAAIGVAILALAITVVIGILRTATAPVEAVTLDVPASAAAPSPSALYVHVSGAVRRPGLYALSPGARVVDAVAAAGGFTDDAATDAVNLARVLADGEQLPVPTQAEAAEAAELPPSAAPGSGLVDLNTADIAALDTLPRIGPALAQRIVDWREQNGGFTSVEDLLAVPGIGEKMLESLRDLVTT
ncbi:ComEA family DNA-binding protein [Microbacterium terricola]|uniref:Helix-hairpin-helix DNA-binding motif class 1 domain-containing protein n=1 Tax=Microbacterium terricola TaxID=344163 RepID=A0ABM8DYU7_9MICO|nr:ComEA family DNA-binding protein [Microbacterium terricola]UYK41484.1 ComEA family DNA-binding protein [Microbacterium terricola]BDV30726.1 hypothetical protein Microterr_13860 [Microbacterium terricola]